MARFAGRGRWLVEEYKFLLYWLLQRVAGFACNPLVASLERKCRLFMIEERRLPPDAVVATGAFVALRAELSGVWVLVAVATGGRRFAELNMQHV